MKTQSSLLLSLLSSPPGSGVREGPGVTRPAPHPPSIVRSVLVLEEASGVALEGGSAGTGTAGVTPGVMVETLVDLVETLGAS